MYHLALNSKLILMAIGVSFIVSGCFSQTGDLNSGAIEPSPRKSFTETLGGSDFKLTPVKDISQINPSEVLSFTCEMIMARPTEATPYCADFGIALANVNWEIWRATGAVGTGVYFANDCKPNCAEGKVIQTPVLINLDGLYTDGQRYFLRYLTFTEKSELPEDEKITDTWDLAQFYLENSDLRGRS
jgi:hypothetical protein